MNLCPPKLKKGTSEKRNTIETNQKGQNRVDAWMTSGEIKRYTAEAMYFKVNKQIAVRCWQSNKLASFCDFFIILFTPLSQILRDY